MAKRPVQKDEVEFAPDAWERFELAVGVVAKAPPQHRVAKKKTAKGKTAKKVKTG